MTESEWPTVTDPTPMLRLLQGKVSDRKLRLFACAAAEHLRSHATGTSDVGDIESLQDVADTATPDFASDYLSQIDSPLAGTIYLYPQPSFPPFVMIGSLIAPRSELCLIETMKVYNQLHSQEYGVIFEIGHANATWVEYSDSLFRVIPIPPQVTTEYGRGAVATLLRDIFGNPFRPVAFDSSWLTSTVLALATGIYAERAFDRLPILADALQDAGCDNDDILTHLRSDGPHVKGCWALDLVLGKA